MQSTFRRNYSNNPQYLAAETFAINQLALGATADSYTMLKSKRDKRARAAGSGHFSF